MSLDHSFTHCSLSTALLTCRFFSIQHRQLHHAATHEPRPCRTDHCDRLLGVDSRGSGSQVHEAVHMEWSALWLLLPVFNNMLCSLLWLHYLLLQPQRHWGAKRWHFGPVRRNRQGRHTNRISRCDCQGPIKWATLLHCLYTTFFALSLKKLSFFSCTYLFPFSLFR